MGLASLAMLLLVGAPSSARADTLPAASDAGHLWVIQPSIDANKHVIRHRADADAPRTLGFAGQFTGQGAPVAVGAADTTLWMIDEGDVLRTITASEAPVGGGWQYQRQRIGKLPTNSDLRAFDAGANGAVALLHITSARTLRQLDGETPATAPRREPIADETARRIVLDLPVRQGARTRTQPATQPATKDGTSDTQSNDTPPTGDAPLDAPPDAPTMRAPDDAPQPPAEVREELAATQPTRADRLVSWQGTKWRAIDLPDDWRERDTAHLVAPASRDAPLRLLARDAEDSRTMRVYERRGDTWQRRAYTLPTEEPIAALAVDGQLVIAQSTSTTAGGRSARLFVLRGERARLLGALSLDAAGAQRWALVPTGLTAALIGEGEPATDTNRELAVHQLWWAQMNLQGSVVQSAQRLNAPEPQSLGQMADYIILITVLVLSVLLLLVFWRKDVRQYQLELPSELALAGFARRAAAGAIDLLPVVLMVMVGFGLGGEALLRHWPGQGQANSWSDIAPGALAIGVFVAHTMVGELIFGRSVGKAMMGLRVTTLTGARPQWWQVVLRNLLKSFDLVAWLLLVLPVLGPYRQRLGDLVGRTVVVMDVPPEQRESEESDDSEE